jgi:hypothetical protein
MAYMRGDYYLWHDQSGLHLWAYDGYDGWDVAGWHEQDEGVFAESHFENGVNKASGVSIHQEVMDEYVMMRLAQMVYEGVVDAAIDRCSDPEGRGGNFGGMMLRANAEKLKQALRGIEMSPPMPQD